DRPSILTIHHVRDAAFAVDAGALADELETGLLGTFGKSGAPPEARGQRVLHTVDRVMRAERTVQHEALHVIDGELRGEHARRAGGERINECGADDEDEGSGECERAVCAKRTARGGCS